MLREGPSADTLPKSIGFGEGRGGAVGFGEAGRRVEPVEAWGSISRQRELAHVQAR